MRQIFTYIQELAAVYGATRLLAYSTAAITTVSAIVVSVLLYVTRSEDGKKNPKSK